MITAEAVLEKVMEIAVIDSEDEAKLLPLCQSAAVQISERIKPNVSASDIRLVSAAASCAYCDFLLLKNASESNIDSFKAGDITVSRDNSSMLKAAEKFKLSALLSARELLKDEGFSFGTI